MTRDEKYLEESDVEKYSVRSPSSFSSDPAIGVSSSSSEGGILKFCCGDDGSKGSSIAELNSNSSGEISSFEDVLEVCKTGKWQFQVFMLASFCGVLTALHNLVYAFIGAKPDSWCEIPDVLDYALDDLKKFTLPLNKDGNYENCLRYPAINGSNFWSDGQLVEGTFPLDRTHTETCPTRTFDNSTFENTIVTEYGLNCGKEAMASLVQAMYMFGILVGSPIFGALSDKLGRKKAITIASIIFILSAPFVALSPNYICLMIARFILGASSPGMYGTAFVLTIEVMAPSWRGLAGNLFCLPFALGYMALPGFAYFFRSWRTLQYVLCIPSLFQLFVCWYIPESPRWLLRKGRVQEAEVLLRKMAATNKVKDLPKDFNESLVRISETEKEVPVERKWTKQLASVLAGYAALIRSPKLRVRTIVLYISWMSISLVYYGVALNSPNLSADRYLYTFISGLLEIPSYFMVPPLIKYFGRRPVFCGYLILTSLCLLSSLLFESGSAMIVALALGGKLLIGSAYALIYLYATEVMPTLLRTYGVGTASMFGRIGSASAPFIVDVMGRDDKTYPTIVFGTVSLIAGLLAILLPETRGKKLPETVKDVENS